jgi:hypothetical protein
MGDRFRRSVLSLGANDIPWVRFDKDEAKLEVMQPHLARQAGTEKPESRVAAIAVAQEFQRGVDRLTPAPAPREWTPGDLCHPSRPGGKGGAE